MRLSPQRLFFPLLVSFSLSGAGVILIYLLNKKKNAGKKEEKKGLKDKKFEAYKEEITLSNQVIPLIIGRGGRELERIEHATSAKLIFGEEIDVISGDRKCFLAGPTVESIRLIREEIGKIVNKEEVIETYEIWAPVRTINRLDQNNGYLLKELQNASLVKIIFDKSTISTTTDLDALRKVTIKGKSENIAEALQAIEAQIREDKREAQENLQNAHTRTPRIKPSYCSLSDNGAPTELENDSLDFHSIDDSLCESALGKPYEVFVCSVENPSRFYIQIIGSTNKKLDDLIQEMTNYYQDEETRLNHVLEEQIRPDQVVATQFSDEKWYRGQVIEKLDDHFYRIFFSDFGDSAEIAAKDLYELSTEFLSLRFQAQETSLYGIKPKDGEWSKQAIEVFSKLSADGQWEARTATNRAWKERLEGDSTLTRASGKEANPVPVIELFEKRDDQLVSINKELVKLELAVAEDHAWSRASSTLSLSRRSTDSPSRNSEPSGSVRETRDERNGHAEKGFGDVEMVTPARSAMNGSRSFLDGERVVPANGYQNGVKRRPNNPFRQSESRPINVLPAGAEFDSDREDYDSDGFDMY
ncbi:tudor and KH domain-containing protein homolog [Copidosoma floridanum]|uniref:tudor and KH domain-containing protein homolog n=1 Tax=Copidosoma floridanum TaxID=29053 RepID=UPI0006C9D84E|nr:tudor and KH domain-containing protein homolog [Copidosoma floridanum]